MFGTSENTLAKLTIEGFQDAALTQPVNTVQVGYNPSNLTLEYGFSYKAAEDLNQTSASLDFEKIVPQNISFDLIFEEQSPNGKTSVQKQLADLRHLCGVRDVTTGAPRYLRLSWGAMAWGGDGVFVGRMTRLVIQHTLFDRDATPIRATAALTVVEDRIALSAHRKAVLGSAKAAERVVRVPDKASLSMIAQRAVVTGLGGLTDRTAVNAVDIALANDMDHLGDFKPGDTLLWPKQDGSAS